jgi:hypothetical protein
MHRRQRHWGCKATASSSSGKPGLQPPGSWGLRHAQFDWPSASRRRHAAHAAACCCCRCRPAFRAAAAPLHHPSRLPSPVNRIHCCRRSARCSRRASKSLLASAAVSTNAAGGRNPGLQGSIKTRPLAVLTRMCFVLADTAPESRPQSAAPQAALTRVLCTEHHLPESSLSQQPHAAWTIHTQQRASPAA